MSKAFKCDRCGGFSEGNPETLIWTEPTPTGRVEKELCNSCIIGLVEYIAGASADDLDRWDIHGCDGEDNAGDADD